MEYEADCFGSIYARSLEGTGPQRVSYLVDDTIRLLQIRKGTKYHVTENCISLRGCGSIPRLTEVQLNRLHHSQMCKSCKGAWLAEYFVKCWRKAPEFVASDPVIVAGMVPVEVGRTPHLVMINRMLEGSEVATSWEVTRGHRKRLAVFPRPVAEWLIASFNGVMQAQMSDLATSDSRRVLETALHLWEPTNSRVLRGSVAEESEFRLQKDALAAARLLDSRGKGPS